MQNFLKGRQPIKKRVLILGSSGQIGHHLSNYLVLLGHEVKGIDVVSNKDHDLRKQGNETLRNGILWADFVFFLAFDVGGSPYLTQYQGSPAFITNNLQIMANVFSELERTSKPFIFASSQMSEMSFSNYGLLKLIGERASSALNGLIVKFWNVYGFESDMKKFHVISDFIHMAQNEGVIRMKSDGNEERDFLFVQDCCEGLRILMESYEELNRNEVFHLASGTWTRVIDIANYIAKQLDSKVQIGEVSDSVQMGIRIEPDLHRIESLWKPTTDIKHGIQKVIEMYKDTWVKRR